MNPAVSRFHLQLEMPFPSDAVLQADCLRPESRRLQHLRRSPQKVLLHCLLCFSPSQDSWCCWGKAVRPHMLLCPQWVHKAAPGLLQPACGRCLTVPPSVSPPGPQSQCLVLPDPSFQGGSQLKLRSQRLLPDQNRAWCEEEQRPLPPVFQSSEISFSKSSAVPFLRALAPLLLGLCESEKEREYRVCMVWNDLHRFSLDKIPPISLMTRI